MMTSQKTNGTLVTFFWNISKDLVYHTHENFHSQVFTGSGYMTVEEDFLPKSYLMTKSQLAMVKIAKLRFISS